MRRRRLPLAGEPRSRFELLTLCVPVRDRALHYMDELFIWTSSLNLTFGCQPSFRPAFEDPPRSAHLRRPYEVVRLVRLHRQPHGLDRIACVSSITPRFPGFR